jgi:hypothetical protein
MAVQHNSIFKLGSVFSCAGTFMLFISYLEVPTRKLRTPGPLSSRTQFLVVTRGPAVVLLCSAMICLLWGLYFVSK